MPCFSDYFAAWLHTMSVPRPVPITGSQVLKEYAFLAYMVWESWIASINISITGSEFHLLEITRLST
jgi:hypothetical protein